MCDCVGSVSSTKFVCISSVCSVSSVSSAKDSGKGSRQIGPLTFFVANWAQAKLGPSKKGPWKMLARQIGPLECWFPKAWSIILAATGAMAGGTQLFERAHLTGGNTRFCRESSKCRNYALFVGQIIKYALPIILGFGSNRPPCNKNSDVNVPL